MTSDLLSQIEARSGSRGWLEPALEEAADPGQALQLLHRWLASSASPNALAEHLAAEPALARLMAAILGASRHAGAILAQNPALAGLVMDPGELLRPLSAQALLDQARPLMAAADSSAYQLDRIRYLRQESDLRIIARDISGLASPEETWREVSEAADALITLAMEASWKALGGDGPIPLAVAAFGKHGGRELNFSSDVDLAFFLDPAVPESDAAPRLAERFVRAMTDRMGRGAVHRVDLRLRPFGGAGPIAPPFSAFERYHLGFAEPWEHMALIRSRVCLGSPLAQERWGELRARTAFRASASEASLAGIFAMRERSEEAGGERDIKRGPGGIRDAEFFAQTLQLLWAAHDESLRPEATLEALAALRDAGKAPPEACAAMREAYIFLRMVEHRRQIQDSAQVHDLPADPAEALGLARSLGMPSREAFEARTAALRAEARRWYEELARPFRPPPDRAEETARARLMEAAPTVAEAVRLSGSKDQLWHALAENSSSADRFRELAIRAPRLLAQIAKVPSLLDQTVSGEVLEPFESEVRRAFHGRAPTIEEAAHRVRVAWLRLLVRWVLGEEFRLERSLSRLTADALRLLAERRGSPLAVITLGSAARMEMTPESDADILITAPEGLEAADAAAEARALSADFTLASQAGFPFGIDLRLRPEGRQGPLAVRRAALDAYAASRMEPWERLAWARADIAAGPAGPLAWLRQAAIAGGLTPQDARRLAAMKERIERERSKGPRDLRLGPGGLDDIQWCLGVLILQSDPGVPACDSRPLLEAFADQGRLTAQEAALISRAQRTWIAARHRLALLGHEGGLLPEDSARMEAVAQVPVKELQEMQAGVRASYIRVMTQAVKE